MHSRGVPAHPVGHDVESELAENREIVLVMVSFSSDVRFAGDFDAERFGHGLPWERADWGGGAYDWRVHPSPKGGTRWPRIVTATGAKCQSRCDGDQKAARWTPEQPPSTGEVACRRDLSYSGAMRAGGRIGFSWLGLVAAIGFAGCSSGDSAAPRFPGVPDPSVSDRAASRPFSTEVGPATPQKEGTLPVGACNYKRTKDAANMLAPVPADGEDPPARAVRRFDRPCQSWTDCVPGSISAGGFCESFAAARTDRLRSEHCLQALGQIAGQSSTAAGTCFPGELQRARPSSCAGEVSAVAPDRRSNGATACFPGRYGGRRRYPCKGLRRVSAVADGFAKRSPAAAVMSADRRALRPLHATLSTSASARRSKSRRDWARGFGRYDVIFHRPDWPLAIRSRSRPIVLAGPPPTRPGVG